MHDSVDSATARRLREHGTYCRRPKVSMRHLGGGGFRFSPVVSKRQGNAVKRNRVKRIIRHFMRSQARDFPSGSYLIIYHGLCDELDRTELFRDLHACADTLRTKTAQRAAYNDGQAEYNDQSG